MIKTITITVAIVLTIAFGRYIKSADLDIAKAAEKIAKQYAYDDFYLSVRNYPNAVPDLTAYQQAMKNAHHQMTDEQSRSNIGFDLTWDMEGAGNIGGRINAVAISPSNNQHILLGAARGGLFKSTNGGDSWQPIFDEQPALSIGAIAIHPYNSNTIYVGTGDRNISAYPGIGTGIYRSLDGGETWENIGLNNTYVISKIVINPTNPNQIFVATMGLPFVRDNNRGVYRSNDGGETWEKVLFVSDQAGAIDLAINSENPMMVYASFWDRIRNNQETIVEGEHAGIWRSSDGGTTWSKLTDGLPTDPIMGRINISICKSNPDILYAAYVAPYTSMLYGVFRSTNGGDSWQQVTASGAEDITGGQGWYYTDIAVHPDNPSQVFLLGLYVLRSTDNGASFQQTWQGDLVHADIHAIDFSSDGKAVIGTDGGAYYSNNSGESWYDLENVPITQFYRTAYNPHYPNQYFAGAQDNGTCMGSSNSPNNWLQYWGGDGFQPVFHPSNSDILFVEAQNGYIYRSNDGGANFDFISNDSMLQDRRAWDMQYIMSKHNPDVLYTGTYRVYKSSNGGNTWEIISASLTDNVTLLPRFHTITTLDESPIDANVLYVGTVDANVWRTTDGGETWDSLHQNGLPNRYVSCIKASPSNTNGVYVSMSGYRDNDFVAHIYKSIDKGNTWLNIAGDMPVIAVNDLYIMPQNDNIIFAATDAGVYGTIDGGLHWERLGVNMPIIPVYDLDYHVANNELIAATFARSLMTYPLTTILNGEVIAAPNTTAPNLQLSVSPNPVTNGVATVKLGKPSKQQLQLFDTEGRCWYVNEVNYLQEIRLSLQHLPSGLYFLRTVDHEGTYGVCRLMINN